MPKTELKFDRDGLITAVIQDSETGDVLMVGYMNREAIARTFESGLVTFWSRSRQKFWVKGETSGNKQVLRDIYVDCDQDCLLIKVGQTGPACHEGYRSCFYRRITDNGIGHEVVAERLRSPNEMYGER